MLYLEVDVPRDVFEYFVIIGFKRRMFEMLRVLGKIVPQLMLHNIIRSARKQDLEVGGASQDGREKREQDLLRLFITLIKGIYDQKDPSHLAFRHVFFQNVLKVLRVPVFVSLEALWPVFVNW